MRFCPRNLIGSVLFLLCLLSCATKPPASPYSPVYVTDRAAYRLLSPAYLEAPLDMPQQLAGRYGKQEAVVQVWVVADEQSVTMALFNSFGTSLGELSFTESGISLSSTVFPASMKPEYIIADFQFCFYRIDAISQALKNSGLTFNVRHQDPGDQETFEVRSIFEGPRLIIEIEKTARMIRYTNHLRDYAYTLEGAF